MRFRSKCVASCGRAESGAVATESVGCASLPSGRETYMVASSLSAFSLSPPSTPSASRSAATPASRSRSCCSLSPSISRSEACFAILNFSVSSLKISAAWFVGLCCDKVWLWFALRVGWVRESCVSEDFRDCRCCDRNWESVLRLSEMRRSEAVSLAILKCDVHWAMSWWGLVCCKKGVLCVLGSVRRQGLRREAF